MTELQQPELVLWNGKLIPWKDATIHVDCPAAKRAVSVFEGIKGYWRVDGSFGIIALRAHFERLQRSAKLLHIPYPWKYEDFEEEIFTIINALLTTEKDMWVRTTLFAVEGHWGPSTKADLVMTAFDQDKAQPEPIAIGISTWQRSSDVSLPCRVKTGSNYQVGRLARIEGATKGCSEMILLNQWGRVAEATGSCVLMVRNGQLITPPAYEGALESITVNMIEEIAASLGLEFVRRPVEKTELLIADELALCGTLAEMVPVRSIEGAAVDPEGPVLSAVRRRFFDVVRGKAGHEKVPMTILPRAVNA